MSLRSSPRFVRYLALSLLVLGLAGAVTLWTVQQHAPKAHAAAGQLVQITNFGNNPTNLQMYLYVPPSVKPHPAILLALHYCTGSGPAFFSGTEFANLADQYGFIVIYPSTPNNGNCWDVFSPKGLARNGGSDNSGLISMITYVEQHNNGDPNNVYVTGASSGAMMTDVMIAEYPDVFKAGSAFMGVPYHCFATTNGSTWNSQCANGQIIMTPQQWGDLVRNDADPGYTGQWPRIQLWHGTADGTLNYNNFGEEIKQWTNVHGLSQTPSSTDSPVSGWTRTRYGGTGTQPPVEGVSIAGAGHVLPETGMAAYAIAFLGLNNISNSTPTATPTRSSSTPTPTPTPRAGTPTPTPPPTSTPISGGNGVTATGTVASNSPYFGEEDIKFSNTSSITSLTATITVQKTTGVSYSSQYATFGSVTMTHADNGSTITYTFTLNAGQTISPSSNLITAAQFGGTGTAHSTTSDLWSITTTSGGVTNTQSGHF
jgi:acetylxylan esterase